AVPTVNYVFRIYFCLTRASERGHVLVDLISVSQDHHVRAAVVTSAGADPGPSLPALRRPSPGLRSETARSIGAPRSIRNCLHGGVLGHQRRDVAYRLLAGGWGFLAARLTVLGPADSSR